MKQGESGRSEVTRKILELAADGEDHAISDFLKVCGCAKNTVYKYLGEMVDDDHYLEKVWGTGEARFKPRLRITQKGSIELEKIHLKTSFFSVVEKVGMENKKSSVGTNAERSIEAIKLRVEYVLEELGVTPAEEAAHEKRYQEWLEKKRQGKKLVD